MAGRQGKGGWEGGEHGVGWGQGRGASVHLGDVEAVRHTLEVRLQQRVEAFKDDSAEEEAVGRGWDGAGASKRGL